MLTEVLIWFGIIMAGIALMILLAWLDARRFERKNGYMKTTNKAEWF
jgi:hypothetical protein